MNPRRTFGPIAFMLLLVAAAPVFAQTITNVIPPLGAFGDSINILGNGFAPGGKAPTNLVVRFNGTLATTNPGVVVSDNKIQVNEPTNCTTGFITVQVNKGAIANSPSQFFVISSNVYITNFSPLFGAANTTVTLTGVHLSSATNVLFNGVLSKSVPGLTPFIGLTNITVTAPDGVTTGPLTVMSSNGPSHDFSTVSNQVTPSATNFFVQPVITSFSPPSGRPGTNVTLQGTNFTGLTAVEFDSVNAVSFTVLNNNSIQAVVPTNTSTGIIQLISPYTSPGFSTGNFRMLPTIYSFSPGSGSNGTLVTVNGAGLNEQSPDPSVSVGGGAVTSFGTVLPNTLSFNVPASASSGPITITTTNGSITSTQLFYLPPSISSFTPIGGGAGKIVTITGNNFTNASSVMFGSIAASFTVTNNTTIGAVVPPGVISAVISVTAPAGTATSTAIFYAPPVITSFTPTHGLPGTNVTITGTSFTSASAVLFNNGLTASFAVTNDSIIGAIVPNGATTGPITVAAPGGTNQSTANFVIDSADLGVSVSALPNPVFVTSNLVYTIIVTNNGPATATSVILTNTLAPSATLKSAGTSQGSLATNATEVVGFLGSINNGGSATVTATVIPSAPGSITNTAFVGSALSDTNLANNVALTVTTVWPLPRLSIANLMSNSLLQVSWPAPLSGFTLQFATNLTANTGWTNDAGAKVVSGTNVSVTETNIGTARFFRLTN